jgi:hypothetical protein
VDLVDKLRRRLMELCFEHATSFAGSHSGESAFWCAARLERGQRIPNHMIPPGVMARLPQDIMGRVSWTEEEWEMFHSEILSA